MGRSEVSRGPTDRRLSRNRKALSRLTLPRKVLPRKVLPRMVALLLTGVLGGCAPQASYPKSEHFDGRRFHNAEPSPKQGFFQIAGHILFDRAKEWPEETLPAEQARFPRHARRGEVVVTFVNHSTLLVQLPAVNVLTDPVWSKRVGPFAGVGPKRAVEPGIPFDELPPIDVVLISHNHFDHMDIPTLRKLEEAHHPRYLVPLGDRAYLEKRSLTRVREMDWWEAVKIGPVEFVFTPAIHNSGRGLWTEGDSLWGSFVVRNGQANVFFAGDTAYGGHFLELRERFGDFDLALLPIGAYLPRDMTAPFHMTPTEAVKAHGDLGATTSIAMHYGTFRMTAEGYHQPVSDLYEAIEKRRDLTGSFIALPEGRTTTVWLP